MCKEMTIRELGVVFGIFAIGFVVGTLLSDHKHSINDRLDDLRRDVYETQDKVDELKEKKADGKEPVPTV